MKDGKASVKQDLLSVLLTTPNEDGSFMSVDDIKDNILLMLFAGHDTSSITLALVLKYLYLHPEFLKEVIQGVHFRHKWPPFHISCLETEV